jgi:hypothetical protein
MVNFQQSGLMMEQVTISQAVVLSLVLLAFVALATVLDWRDSHMRSGASSMFDIPAKRRRR